MMYRAKRPNFGKIKSKVRQFGNSVRLVGGFGKEIAKRAISPSYTHSKVFGKPRR